MRGVKVSNGWVGECVFGVRMAKVEVLRQQLEAARHRSTPIVAPSIELEFIVPLCSKCIDAFLPGGETRTTCDCTEYGLNLLK